MSRFNFRNRRHISLVFSFLLTALLLAAVLTQLDIKQFTSTFQDIKWFWVLSGLFFSLIYQIFRTIRFSILSSIKNDGRLFTTLCIQAVVRKFFPSWLGEVAAIWLLKHYHNLGIHRGTASVLVGRIIDLALFSIALIIAITMSAIKIDNGFEVITVLLISFFMAGSICIFILMRLEKYIANTGIKGGKIRTWLLSNISALGQGFRDTIQMKSSLQVAFFSTLMWISMYMKFLCFIRALGGEIVPIDIFWLYILIFPISLLPVRGIADIGTYEAAWFIALTILGLSSNDAALLAVGTHILTFLSVGMYLVLGLIGIKYFDSRKSLKV